MNPQLKGHLKGALNNGASREEVRAVRQLVVRICEEAGMRRLRDSDPDPELGGWGWRDEIADL